MLRTVFPIKPENTPMAPTAVFEVKISVCNPPFPIFILSQPLIFTFLAFGDLNDTGTNRRSDPRTN